MKQIGLVISLAISTSIAGQAGAVDYANQYDKKIRAAQTVGALGNDLAGDQVNFQNGATTFVVTDVSLEGNNSLSVAVGRKFSVEYMRAASYAFGDWELDLPNIRTVVAAQNGWVVNSPEPSRRCSITAQANGSATQAKPPALSLPPDNSNLPQPMAFIPEDYWHGYSLNLPNGGSQPLLLAASANTQRPTVAQFGAFPWTTNKDWWFSCLSVANSPQAGGGEGFLGHAPDGTKYWFNHLVAGPYEPVEKEDDWDEERRWVYTLNRAEHSLYPTRIEDRFGNWVNYTWVGNELRQITSSDGRTLNLTWTGSRITEVSHGTRKWLYNYQITNGVAILESVGLPDGKNWTYGLGSLTSLQRPYIWCPDYQYPITIQQGWDCYGGGIFQGSDLPKSVYVVHPSGARVDFTFDVHFVYSYAGWLGHYAVGMAQKTISGPGLTPATWKFSVAPNRAATKTACMAGACPVLTTADQLNPDGSLVRRIFGATASDQSQLQGELYGATGSGQNSGGTPAITCSARWGCGLLSSASPTNGATPTFYREEDTRYVPTGASVPYLVTVGDPLTGYETLTSRSRIPVSKHTTTLQGVQFTRETTGFDTFARPAEIVSSSVNGSAGPFSLRETVNYYNDTAKWVLGQEEVRRCYDVPECNGATGRITRKTTYSAATALPWKSYSFEDPAADSTLTYHADGTVATAADGNGNTIQLPTWSMGVPTSISFPDWVDISATLGGFGQVASVLNQVGGRTCYEYDDLLRLTKITYTDNASTACNATVYNVTTVNFNTSTPLEYGLAAGHWQRITKTGDGSTRVLYNALWQPLVEITEDLSNASTRSFVVHRYDGMGRRVFTSYPVDTLISVNDALTGTRTYYDALGRVTRVQQDAGGSVSQSVLNADTSYISGFRTQATNPRGFSTTTAFQVFDSPSTESPAVITMPEGVTTTITRDVFGKPKTIKRAGVYNSVATELTRSYIYDDEERLCVAYNPESGSTVTQYDLAGNAIWTGEGHAAPANLDKATCTAMRATAGAAPKTSRQFDPMNRVTQVSTPGNVADTFTVYELDGKVKQITAMQPNAETVRNVYYYNRRRLLTQETLQVNANTIWTFNYNYNANGHLESQTYPGNLLIGYAPDALGRPTQAGTFATGVTYHPNGAIKRFNYGNGIVHTMTQDHRKLPANSRDATRDPVTDAVITRFLDDTYTYDPNGNVLSLTDASAAPTVDNRTWGVLAPTLYDGLDRLKSVRSTNQWGSPPSGSSYNAIFTYDPLDNLRQLTTGASTYVHSYDLGVNGLGTGTNRLASTQLNGGTVYGFTHDTLGRMTSNGLKNQNYQFDPAHRMTAVTNKESYIYDGHGRRARSVNALTGTIEYFGYGQDGRLLQDWSNRRNIRNGYVYLGNTIVGLFEVNITNGGIASRYKHTDALGSPVVTTDAAKNIIGRQAYTPYGASATGTIDGAGYTGHFMDVGTGLTYMQQRYYDPQIGRFLQIDPVEVSTQLAQNFTRFAYAGNNPATFYDPDGREFKYAPGTPKSFLLNVASAFRQLNAKGQADGVGFVHSRPEGVMIVPTNNRKDVSQNRYDPNTKTIYWADQAGLKVADTKTGTEGTISPILTLGHEVEHAANDLGAHSDFVADIYTPDADFDTVEERTVIEGWEHPAADAFGAPRRGDHSRSGTSVQCADVGCN